MQPIQNKKIAELVTDSLLSKLESKHYTSGQRLPSVEALASHYQVGRSTIREALSALKAMGWLDIRHGGGTFVREQSQDPAVLLHGWLAEVESLKSLIEVRKIIEVGSAGLAARCRTEDDLISIEACLLQMEAHLDNETESQRDDLIFHIRIAEASHNKLLIPMLELFHRECAKHIGSTRRMWLFGERSSTLQLLQEHRHIFEAIQQQDEELASSRMLEHLIKVEAILERQ